MNLLNKNSLDIFPYFSDNLNLLNKIFPEYMKFLIKIFFQWYYLYIISQLVFNQSFVFIAIQSYMKEILKVLFLYVLLIIYNLD